MRSVDRTCATCAEHLVEGICSSPLHVRDVASATRWTELPAEGACPRWVARPRASERSGSRPAYRVPSSGS